jgi:hypothetical protein
MPTVNMNISENYVLEWKEWEVAREVICNAMDTGSYKIVKLAGDHLRVSTSASPSFAELMTIGASTKMHDESKIGQFGEGFKLAALVATRMGGSLVAKTPKGTLTFALLHVEGLLERVLHANIDARRKGKEGCVVDIKLHNISNIIEGRFCDATKTMLPKYNKNALRIYNKGVFVEEREEEALFDWNLHIGNMNRDRSIINPWDVRWNVGNFLSDQPPGREAIEKMFENSNLFETKCFLTPYHLKDTSREIYKEVFYNKYGDKAVIASRNQAINQTAYAKGYYPVPISLDFDKLRIQKAEEVVETKDSFVETFPDKKFYEEGAKIQDLLNVTAKVRFFKNFNEAPEGQAGRNEIWINDNLTLPGKRLERITAIAHELAHIASNAGDCTREFEAQQSEMLAKLIEKRL